jgi:hypothetical protein
MMGRMGSVNIRRLAALDLHGTAGTRLRRRLVIAEFFLGAVGGAGFGVWIAVFAAAAGTQAFGGWMAGVGVNYAALAWQTIPLSRPGASQPGAGLLASAAWLTTRPARSGTRW